MNFIIWCPMAYTESSGGIIALHKLAHNLALLGEKSFITTVEKHPEYLGQQISEDEAMKMDKESSIVIYPEIVKGNPFGFKHVMRWLLNTPGVIAYGGGDGVYSNSDLVYKFADIFKAPDESKVSGILTAFELHFDLFKNMNIMRNGSCYIVKKGAGKPLTWHDKNAINVEGRDNAALAYLFNACETFISYDDACFLSVQAAMCGCLSIVVPKDGMSKEDWHNKYPAHKYGIAYGADDVIFALATQSKVIPNLQEMEKETLTQAKAFIERAKGLINPQS
jgi:hypothetical protein